MYVYVYVYVYVLLYVYIYKLSDRRCSDLNTRNKLVALPVNLTYNSQDHP